MKKTQIIVLLVLCSVFVPGQKRSFTLDDIYRVKGIGAPAVSPGGKMLAFTVTDYTLKGGKSKSVIHTLDLDSHVNDSLFSGEKGISAPFWGSNPDLLYFYKVVDGHNQVFEYSFSGKEKRQITNFPNDVVDAVISPDGKLMAFTSEVYADCSGDQDCIKRNLNAAADGPIQAYLTDDLLFRHWTAYTEGRVNHIFIFDLMTNMIKDITPYNYNCPVFSVGGGGRFVFSPDSKLLCYAANPDERKANSTNSDLWLYDIASGSVKNITAQNKAWDGSPKFSPDGNFIAYRCQSQAGYESDCYRIACYDIRQQRSKILTDGFDYWVEDFVWAPGRKIYFTAEVKSYVPIFSVDLETKNISKSSPDKVFTSMQITPDGKSIICLGKLMNQPVEIFKAAVSDGKVEMLTAINKSLTDEVDFRKPEQMWIAGADGKNVHVLLVLPHEFDPAKKYPLIVNVHGGPQSQWADAYRPDAQLYAGYGYITAFPNPHGSTGYGQNYTEAISGDWGGKVYEDVMKVTDSLSNLPYVDNNRMGAMGWSFGGYMMNWLQGHTKRYKCFASMMGLYNLESFYGTTEELWFPEWDIKGTPWDRPELYKAFSPHNFVNNFSTPTLIITGEKDFRVSYTQSLEYFTALRKKNIDSRLIVFKNDGHWPSGIKSMPLYYNAHLEWFNKYLGGKPAPYNSEKLVRNMEELK